MSGHPIVTSRKFQWKKKIHYLLVHDNSLYHTFSHLQLIPLWSLYIYIYIISFILVGVSWTHQNTPKSLHLTSIRRDSPPLVSSSFDLRPGMAKSWWSAHLPGDSGERCHGAMPATPWKSVASSIDIPKTCGVSVWSTLGQKKLLSSEMVSLSNSYFGMWSLPYALLCC